MPVAPRTEDGVFDRRPVPYMPATHHGYQREVFARIETPPINGISSMSRPTASTERR
jgi:hypothetical protein